MGALATTHALTHPSRSATDASRWSALPVLLAGAFMVVLDFFIVNVALPVIATDLQASESSLEWIVAGYGLAVAAVLIVAGRLGDLFGRRKLYAAGLGSFTLTSLACGLAPDPTFLVIARVAQGVAAGILMPQVLSTIAVTYQREERARAMSLYGVTLGLAAVGGQLIGGALVQTDVLSLGWRGCFLMNVPLGLAGLLATPRFVPESRAEVGGERRICFDGALLLAVGLVAILLPVIQGREYGWPVWTWISLAAGLAILAAFVGSQRRLARRGQPALVDLRLFDERTFSAGLGAMLALSSVQAAFFVYLAFYLQQGRGLKPLQAGLVFTILAVAYVVASGPAPKLTAKHGRKVVAAGGLTLLLGLVVLAVAVAVIGVGGLLFALVPGLVLVGAGIGLTFTPIQQTVLSNVDPARAGAASGMLSTIQQVGFALGVAMSGVVYFGAADQDIAEAFQTTLWQMAAFAVEIVALTALLPRPRRDPKAIPQTEPAAA